MLGPGTTEEDAAFASARATLVVRGSGADRWQGLNVGVQLAAARGIEVLSWLEPGMLPCCAATWQDFLARFTASGRAVTFCPVVVNGSIPDWTGLHVAPSRALADGWFPVAPPRDFQAGDDGLLLANAWSARRWRWMEATYLLWSLTLAPQGVWGVAPGRSFRVERYYPDTSMVVTRDAWFWEHYAEIVNMEGVWNRSVI